MQLATLQPPHWPHQCKEHLPWISSTIFGTGRAGPPRADRRRRRRRLRCRLCPCGAAGLGPDHHRPTPRAWRPARSRSRPPPGRSRPTARSRAAPAPARWSWSCRRSSASTSTSRTSAAGSPSSATSPSRPSCTPARATSRRCTDIQEIIAKVVSKVPDAQVMSDLDATVAWAKSAGKGDTGQARHHRLLLGRPDRLALRRAQPGPEGRRRLVRPAGRRARRPLHPKNPIDLVADAQGPGARPLRRRRPGHPGRHASRRCSRRSRHAGKPVEIVVYPDTPHAFYADYRPTYREAAAEDGWKRLLDWFKQHGVA